MPANPEQLDTSAETKDHKFFFMVGHVRSGTNWVQSLLNLHPKISCLGEYHFQFISNGVDRFTSIPYGQGSHERERKLTHQWFENLIRECLLCQASLKPGAIWLGDRTPRPLRPLLPDCPIIYLVRDVRDVVVSWTFHELLNGGPTFEPYKTTMAEERKQFDRDPEYFQKNPERLFAEHNWLRHLTQVWAKQITGDLDMIETIRASDPEALGATVHMVKYEQLHLNTLGERDKMYRFLDLDPAEAEELSSESLTVAGFKRENPRSHYRKGRAGDWKTYATDAFRTIVKQKAGDVLIRLGYEQDLNW